MTKLVLRLALGAVVLFSVAEASAQDGSTPPRPAYSSLLNVDAMIDNYARLVARKYGLTPEQDAYTQQLIRERSNAFLAEHRDQLFPIVDRLFEVRAGGEIGPAEMMQWAQIAAPIYEKAKAIIVDANNEWRQILDERQRKIHDADVQLMWQNFSTAEDQLQRMKRGEMSVDEFRQGRPVQPAIGPGMPSAQGGTRPPKPTGAAPPKTPSAGDGGAAGTDPKARLEELRRGRRDAAGGAKTSGMAGLDFESKWEQYVRDFIQKHQLDEGQTQRANSILKDCLDQGRSYMARKKSEVEDLDKKIQEAQGKPDKAAELKQLNEQRTRLLEPLERIFDTRLKPRLDRIPTSAQREAAGTDAAKPDASKPKVPASQPKP